MALLRLKTTVVGRKRFYIVPPHAARLLDLCPDPPHQNTSRIPIPVSTLMPESGARGGITPVNLDGVAPEEVEKHASALSEAAGIDGSCVVDLKPGESVLVPEGWFHSAEGLDAGVGVNAWFR